LGKMKAMKKIEEEENPSAETQTQYRDYKRLL
jgi:hypothetical protein